ncbi:hypothetical protein BDV28DRAFT_155998 [Aspergillus coremiiformis]|uniref:Uncharacterized protein n=1 Tax=Aspergillus coremiiformis TaxID=138285 RepID=A0A5N6ZC63_9EURO|nr:hypothetical protein BDV28DRAFT_155998 [Aspergillus coremiiformis]
MEFLFSIAAVFFLSSLLLELFSLHPLVDNAIAKGDETIPGTWLCSQCWKPSGTLFSVVGAISKEKLSVTVNGAQLEIVDKEAAVQWITPVKGHDFVQVELSNKTGWKQPQCAGFVSSILEQGVDPGQMDEVWSRFGLLMDALAIATSPAKGSGKSSANL